MAYGKPIDRPANVRGMSLAPKPPEGHARLLLNVIPDGTGVRTRPGGVLFTNARAANSGLSLLRCLGVTDFRGPTNQFYSVAVFADETMSSGYITVNTGVNQVYVSAAIPLSSDFPCSFAKFGKDLFIAGPWRDNRVYRLRFEIDGDIFETEAFAYDRTSPLYQRGGDDPGPYLSRAPQGRIIGSNGTRLFILDGDVLRWSNLGDADAFPANNAIPLGGAQNDPGVGMAYLWGAMHIFKQRSIWRVTGDFATLERTRADVVATGVGLVSHRGIVMAGGRVLLLTTAGVRPYNGNDLGDSLSAPIDSLLRAEQPFGELGDEIGRVRPSRGGLSNAWAAYDPRLNAAKFVMEGDRPYQNTISAWYHFDTDGWSIHTHPAMQAGAWIPASDGFGYFVTGSDNGFLFVQNYGPNDVRANTGLTAAEAVALDTRFVPQSFRTDTLATVRLRFSRVRAEAMSSLDVTFRVRPFGGSAPVGWTEPTFTTMPLGSDAFDVFADVAGDGFRLDTDRLETDRAVEVKRGVPGFPSADWYFEVASNALNAEWKLYSYGADVVPEARR